MKKIVLNLIILLFICNLYAFNKVNSEEYLNYIDMYGIDSNISGVIPVPFNVRNQFTPSKVVLPTKFDLRLVDSIMPVRSQNPYNTCWAFSTCSSLESCAMKNVDFSSISISPLNMANKNPIDWVSLNSGGNCLTSMAYLGNMLGPISEEDDPYVSPYESILEIYNKNGVCEEVEIVEDGNKGLSDDEILAIKELVYTKGAMQLNYQHNANYFNSTYKSYYSPNILYNNGHAVTIVGWDDSFSKNKFTETPSKNGAFLIKNSWGTNWGNNGYFWMSYYDVNINYCALFEFSNLVNVNYNKIYSYNGSSMTDVVDAKYGAMKFKANENANIKGVQLYSFNNNSTYNFKIYVNDTLKASKSYTFKYMGYKNVILDSDIFIAKDDIIWVEFENNLSKFPVEGTWLGYVPKNYQEPYCSYYSNNGIDYIKLKDNYNLSCGLLMNTDVVVYPTKVELDYTSLALETNNEITLNATVYPYYVTDPSVSWFSSNTSVAKITTSGKITAKGPGEAVITCKCKANPNIKTKCYVKVTDPYVSVESVNLNKKSLTLLVGKTEQLEATVLPENATDKSVTWKSLSPTIVSVSSVGEVTALKKGSAFIRVTTNDGKKMADCKINVVESIPVKSISLNKKSTSVIVRKTEQLVATILPEDATNKNVIWRTENSSIATISSKGIIRGIKAGTTTIKVTSVDGGYVAKCSVTVKEPVKVTSVFLDKSNINMNIGDSEQLTATVLPYDATNKNVTWKSGNSKVATVSKEGLVNGIAKGTTYITVTTRDQSKTAKCKITVNKIIPVTNVNLNKTKTTLEINKTEQLEATILPNSATDKTVTWSTSNSKVATVSTKGLVKGIGVGSTIITVSTKDGNKKATCKVTVKNVKVSGVTLNKYTLNLKIGKNDQLVATVLPENASNKNVTWSTTNSQIITLSQTGIVLGRKTGTCYVIVTTKDQSKTAKCKVVVK